MVALELKWTTVDANDTGKGNRGQMPLPSEREALDQLSRIRLETIIETVDYALQPIVDLMTGVAYASEGLVRHTEDLGYAAIYEMFDHALADGYLAELEVALFRKLIEKFSRLPNAADQYLFINLDGRDVTGADDPRGEIIAIARSFGVSPTALCFEIAESHQAYVREPFRAFIGAMRNRGIRIAADDFGRDFSGYRLIYEYEPDYVKIDRYFIDQIDRDHRKRVFVSTIGHLAHVMGARVIAEGIETADELGVCREINCDLGQGYYIARPAVDLNRARPCYEIAAAAPDSPAHAGNLIVRSEILQIPPVSINAPLEQIVAKFASMRESGFLPVVNERNEPLGLIHEANLKRYTHNRFGFSLLENSGLDLSVRAFVTHSPIADINADPDAILDIFAGVLNSDGVTIVEGGKYVGFLTNTALLKMINEKRIRQARDQNPLSRLPGNGSITDFIAEIGLQSGSERTICYIDFDNFKPFNDNYGFHIGDRAIMLFSDLMRKLLCRKGVYLGHVGGDDFFVGFLDSDLPDILKEMAALKQAFRHEAESLYTVTDRTNGFITSSDRHGRTANFPLLDCSIAILHLEKGACFEQTDALARETAQAKHKAKASSDGFAITCLNTGNDGLDSTRCDIDGVDTVKGAARICCANAGVGGESPAQAFAG